MLKEVSQDQKYHKENPTAEELKYEISSKSVGHKEVTDKFSLLQNQMIMLAKTSTMKFSPQENAWNRSTI